MMAFLGFEYNDYPAVSMWIICVLTAILVVLLLSSCIPAPAPVILTHVVTPTATQTYTPMPTSTAGATPTSANAPTATPSPTVIPEALVDDIAKTTWNYLVSTNTTANNFPYSWYSSQITGGDYANTAEIGLYALSWLAAFDLNEEWSPEWDETQSRVTEVLDQMRAWQTGSQTEQPHGPNAYANSVFYQFYWISWNPPVVSSVADDHLVPSIDNAWLALSLITIREYAEAHEASDLAAKADAILSDMNFRLWFNPETYLFTWGKRESPQTGDQAETYSNENRVINFVARAMGHISEDEFAFSLDAMGQVEKVYGDIVVQKVAYDGSYFTYLAPALFIKEMETGYAHTTIEPVTKAQIEYAKDRGYSAWGMSDCFDVGDGGYLQQGAPPGNKKGALEDHMGVISPHVSALALITSYQDEAIQNFRDIMTIDCAYDEEFGFVDSVLVSAKAPKDGVLCSYRYSALGQEWLFLSIVNYETGFIWEYFYRDDGVQTAHEEMYP